MSRKKALGGRARLGSGGDRQLSLAPQSTHALTSGTQPEAPSVEDQMNAAIGCKTSEVALAVLAQVVLLESSNVETESEERVNARLATATAMLGELEPTTAVETMLAAQMIGSHRMVMHFSRAALAPGQMVEVVDRNVTRAARMMRLFNEQTETMAKLKGKGGQQRVVVEHVTVAAGGQAIVGTVSRSDPGGKQG